MRRYDPYTNRFIEMETINTISTVTNYTISKTDQLIKDNCYKSGFKDGYNKALEDMKPLIIDQTGMG